MLKKITVLLVFITTLNIYSQDFEEVSKSLAFLEFPGGKSGLGAITEKEARTYVITTQSLFLKYGHKFTLKDFAGNKLKAVGTMICPDADLMRFEIETNHFIKPLKLGGEPKALFQVNPDFGAVSQKNYELKELKEPGSVIIAEDGSLAGFGSYTIGFDSTKSDFVPVTEDVKWGKSSIRSFGTQVSNLREMRDKLISVERLKRVNKMNSYVEFKPIYHESHTPWVKDCNAQYEVSVFDSKGGKSAAAAKFKHESRCRHYAAMKRLSIFAGNISQIDRMTKWQSKFFKGLSKQLDVRADKLNKNLKGEMSRLVKAYPATKAKN